MANTDEKILQALENIQADVKNLKQGQGNLAQGQTETHKRLSNLEDGQAHLTTVVEALAAGQQDMKEKMSTKADVQDIKADLVKQQRRIENVEENTKTPNPHKN